MGRSVSVPSGAVAVCYVNCSHIEEWYEWDDFADDVFNVVESRYSSFFKCDTWLDREDHAIAENDHAYVVVAEYCGLASISLVPKCGDYHPELSESWCRQVADNFRDLINKAFGGYNKVATFSNGEAWYEKIG